MLPKITWKWVANLCAWKGHNCQECRSPCPDRKYVRVWHDFLCKWHYWSFLRLIGTFWPKRYSWFDQYHFFIKRFFCFGCRYDKSVIFVETVWHFSGWETLSWLDILCCLLFMLIFPCFMIKLSKLLENKIPFHMCLHVSS